MHELNLFRIYNIFQLFENSFCVDHVKFIEIKKYIRILISINIQKKIENIYSLKNSKLEFILFRKVHFQVV